MELLIALAILVPLSLFLCVVGWVVVGVAFGDWIVPDMSGVYERFLVGGATMCVVGGLFGLVNLVMGVAGL